MTQQDVDASNAVIADTIEIYTFLALSLFDPGSTHSYVSHLFTDRFEREPCTLARPFSVGVPSGKPLRVETVYRSCEVVVEGVETLADLIVLDMVDFDALLGMD